MKYFYKTILVFLVLSITQAAFASYYSYHFDDDSESPKMTESYGGNIDLPLRMNLWLKESGNIRIKLEKIDGTAMPKGLLYLQQNTNGDAPMKRIESVGSDGSNIVDGHYVKALTSVQTLDNIPSQWNGDKMFVYSRFENEQGDYAWVGPIVIVRKTTPETGNLKVTLTPKEAAENARWRYETPDGWTDWIESGKTIQNLAVGDYHIRFNDISDKWLPPVERYVSIERGETTEIKEIYKYQLAGGIQFSIGPAEAVAAGAKCRAEYPPPVGFSDWFFDGDTAYGFDPGTTKVECFGLPDWDTPLPRTVTVPSDKPVEVNITYCKTFPYKPKTVHASQGIFIDRVQLTWSPVSCVERYDIYRSRDDQITFDERIAANYSDVVFEDMDADPSYEYYYSVVGINENGEGEFSTPVVGFKKLASPENLGATDGLFTNKVRLTWDAIPGATSYEIWRNAVNDPTTAIMIDEGITDTVYGDSTVIPEKQYFFWVKATNSFTKSDLSNADNGSMDLAIPSNVQASVLTYDNGVLITWSAVNGATTYHVKYILAQSKKRSARPTDEFAPATEFWHTTAIPGQRYFYQVRAENPFGHSEYSASRFGIQAMKKPEIFASKRTYPEKIRVSWTEVEGATEYRLYRSKQDDFSTAEILYNSVIGTHQEDATIDTDHFYYWVEARNDYTSQRSDSARGYISDNCEFQLNKTEIEMKSTGDESEICLTTESACQWDAESRNDWLSILSQTSGQGNACLTIKADISSSADSRKGAVSIAGQEVIVSQAGLNTFAVSINKKGNGTVKVNGDLVSLPYNGRFVLNESVEVEAIPGNEWQFDYFSGNVTRRENPMVFSINEDSTIVAEFSPVKYFVSVSLEGSGIISMNNEETISGLFAKGERVILQAKPENQFSGWTGDINSTENPLIFTVDSDISMVGKFDGWMLDIMGKGADLGGIYHNTVTIGVASQRVSVSAPPTPPSFSSYLVLKDESNWTDSMNHFVYKKGEDKYVWILAVNPKGNMGVMEQPGSTLISWNADLLKTLQDIETIEMRKGSDGNGEIIIEDMRTTDSFEVKGNNEYIYYCVVLTIDTQNCNPGDPDCHTCMPDNNIQLNIQLEGDELGGMFKYNSFIGTAELEKKTPAAPKPPKYSCYMASSPPPENWQALADYLLPCSPIKKVWYLMVDPVGNMHGPNATATAKLSWDLTGTGNSGSLQLISGTEGDGEVIVADMRSTREYTVEGDSEMYFRVIWTPGVVITKCMNIDLVEGWNLVSLSVAPESNEIDTIFPDAEIAYGYGDGTYYKATELFPNEGYWVKMPFAQTYQVCGDTISSYSVDLSKGWHLKGCTSHVEIPGTNNDQIEVMYEYQYGSYMRIDECTPGYGFWVRLKEADTFFVSDQY